MRTHRIELEDVASRENLAEATFRAARGKRHRPEVHSFLVHLDANLGDLGRSIREGTVRVGEARTFRIRDPKERVIVAPCFRERVLHHALMNQVGPVLERAMVNDSYACRVGKGSLAAVARAQQHVRRFPWYAKMDIRAYFASIDHAVLRQRLRRRVKGGGVLSLIDRIIDAHSNQPGKGLPIGALTSQCFANFYLDALDRYLLEHHRVAGYIRYMDDFIFWTTTRAEAVRIAGEAAGFVAEVLALAAKQPVPINRSDRGITVCGFRVRAQSIRPGRRRRLCYLDSRRRWESEYRRGGIDALALQRGHDAALAITAHGDVRRWLQARQTAAPGREWYEEV